MTNLEAKIKSEFAAGDPTESDIDVTKGQPMAMRVSLKRVVPAIALVLLISGGTITYYAANNHPKKNDLPAAVTVKPAEVQGDTQVQAPTPTTPPTTGKSVHQPAAKPAAAITAKPAAPAPLTSTPNPTPVPTPTAKPATGLSAVTDLANCLVSTTSGLVSATLSVAL
jgi:hypothetical protein